METMSLIDGGDRGEEEEEEENPLGVNDEEAKTASRTKRISKAEMQACIVLFEKHKWTSLPRMGKGKRSVALHRFMELHSLSRAQVKTQHVKWKIGNVPSSLPQFDKTEYMSEVNEKIGDEHEIFKHVEAKVLESSLLRFRPWWKAGTSYLTDLKRTECAAFWHKIILFFKEQVVACFTSSASNISASSRRLSLALYAERRRAMLEFVSLAWVISAVNGLPPDTDIEAVSKKHLLSLTFGFIWDELVPCLRAKFHCGSSLQLKLKESVHAQSLVHQVPAQAAMYYIAGAVLSKMEKSAKRGYIDFNLVTCFVNSNSMSSLEAEKEGLPFKKIMQLDRGSLYYPSRIFFRFICCVMHHCEPLLTTSNLIAFGSQLFTKIKELLAEDEATCEHFSVCTESVCSLASECGVAYVDSKPIFDLTLDYLMRTLGKDYVRKLSGLLIKSADHVNSTRQALGAVALMARRQNVKRSAEQISVEHEVQSDENAQYLDELVYLLANDEDIGEELEDLGNEH